MLFDRHIIGPNGQIGSGAAITRQGLEPEPSGDRATVAVLLEPHPLGIDLGGDQVLMPQGVLDVGQAAGLITDHTSEGVAGLMEVDVVEASFPGVVFEIAGKAV